MDTPEFKNAYASVLKSFVESQEEQYLMEAAEMGREMVRAGVPPEDIAEIHEEALRRLAEKSADTTPLEFVQRSSSPLMEMLMAYGLAFREREDERKRAVEALCDSEEKVRSLFEQSMDAIYVHGTDGKNITANRAWLDLFGYTRDELPGLDSRLDIYAEPHDRDDFLRRIAETGHVEDEVRFKKKDGAVMDCVRNVVARKDEHGNVVAYQGVIHDITALKRGERELWRLSEFRETVIDNANVWLDVLDAEANVVVWNKAAEKISGYSAGEVVGHGKIWEWLYPDEDYRKQIEEKAAGIIEGDVVEGLETTVRTKGGEYRTISWHSRNLTDEKGQSIGSLALGRDITEQKKAQEELRESEQKYRSLFERSLDAIALADVNGTLLDANPAYLKMYGHGVEDIGRVNVTQFYDRQSEREDVIRQLREEGAVVGEVRQRKRDGTVMDCFRASVPVNDDAGNLVAIQSVIRDITDSKRAQTELVESREELRRLAQRMEKAREEERTNLARELHDTAGQAITAVKLDVSHIKKRLEQGQAPTPEELAALNDLLDQTADDVRRISSELRPGVLDDIGLDGAIEWQIDELRNRTALDCTVSLPSEGSQLDDARRTTLFRVFQELLTNVVRHSEARSVHVTLESAASVVTLTVADDGCGVDMEKLDDSSSIGIIGMRERLRPHGGELHYDSAPGRGTTARVVMPMG